MERGSFLDFLTKDVLKPDHDNDESEFLSAKEEEDSDDNEEEEVRRKTIMRINQRKGHLQVPDERPNNAGEDPTSSDILDEDTAEPIKD